MNKKIYIFPIALLSLLFFHPSLTLAHKDHAGASVDFISIKEALRAMLPKDTSIVKRKEELSPESRRWAKEKYAIEIEEKLYTYYLAREKGSKRPIAAAMITSAPYRHGDVVIGAGASMDGKITASAVLSVNEKYVADFKNKVGTGIVNHKLTITEINKLLDNNSCEDQAYCIYLKEIRTIVIALQSLLRIGIIKPL
jgi:hypothetical protein